jgi:hypothetical protein
MCVWCVCGVCGVCGVCVCEVLSHKKLFMIVNREKLLLGVTLGGIGNIYTHTHIYTYICVCVCLKLFTKVYLELESNCFGTINIS